jgi:hypothetical protein
MEGNDMTVNELLQEAKDLNFEAVIIIGYKDNDIKIKSWNQYDIQGQLVLLELAKAQLIMKGMSGG